MLAAAASATAATSHPPTLKLRRTSVTRNDGFRAGGAAVTTVIRVSAYRWRRSRYNPASPAPINSSVEGSGVEAGEPDDPPPPITPTLGAVSGAS